MPDSRIDVSFNKEQNYVLIRIIGKISYDDAVKAYDQALHAPQHRRGMSRIWDLTHANLSMLGDEYLWMASRYSAVFPEDLREVKAAIVSESDKNRELVRQIKEYANGAQEEIETFDSLVKAIEWVSKG